MFIRLDVLCHPEHDVKKYITNLGKSTLSSDLSWNFSDARETGRLSSRKKFEIEIDLHKNTFTIRNPLLYHIVSASAPQK